MRVVVGRIVRAHGIRGEVVVEPRTDRPQERFAPGSVLGTSTGATLTVRSVRRHADRLLVRLRGVSDRQAAERLRGTTLEVDLDPAQARDEAEVYPDAALVGLRVVAMSGAAVGHVVGVEHLPVQDLLVVRHPDGSQSLVPFVEAIVVAVCLDAGYVRIDPPDGLLPPRPEEG